MAGFLERSVQKRRELEILRLVRDEEPLGTDDLGISPDERAEFRDKLTDVVRRRTAGGMQGIEPFVPSRSGAVLPTTVIICAVLVVGAVGYGLFMHFNAQRESLVSVVREVESTDVQILRAMREEAEAQLELKDREIGEVEARLEEMAREQLRLQEEAVQRVEAREAELQEALASEMETLRQDLQRQGASSEVIDRQVKALQAVKQAEYEGEIAALREEAAAELREQEAAIKSLAAEFESALEQARIERDTLETEHSRRMAEATAERSLAEQELAALEDQRRTEQLVGDQILASYEMVQELLAADRYEDARSSLLNLQTYLDGAGVRSVPGLQRRRTTELFVIDALRDLIGEREASTSEESANLVHAARLLQTVAGSFEEAEGLLGKGKGREAEELYRSTVTRIPAVAKAFERLETAQKERLAARWEAVGSMVDDADALYLADDPGAAMTAYTYALVVAGFSQETAEEFVRRASESGSTVTRRTELVQDDAGARPLLVRGDRMAVEGRHVEAIANYASLLARYGSSSYGKAAIEGVRQSVSALQEEYVRFLEEEQETNAQLEGTVTEARKDMEDLLTSVQAETAARERDRSLVLAAIDAIGVATTAVGDEAGTRETEDEMLDLIETKLRLRRVLTSPAIRRDYPELYEGLQEYLDAVGRENLRLGREQAARDAAALVDAVARTADGLVPGSLEDVVRRLDESGYLTELARGLSVLAERGGE